MEPLGTASVVCHHACQHACHHADYHAGHHVCHHAFERLNVAIMELFADEYQLWGDKKQHDASCVSPLLSVGRGGH